MRGISLVWVGLAVLGLAADWPNIHGPNRDGTSPEKNLNWNWQAKKPTVLWSKELGSGFAGVAVARGKVFAFHRQADQEILQAFDAKSGEALWKQGWRSRFQDSISNDDGPRCVPVVSGSVVIALGSEGQLQVHDAAKGELVWQKNILKEYKPPQGYFGVGAGPLVLGDRLLVNVGAKKAGLVAFDLATGQELWKATDDPPGYSAPAVMTFNNEQLAIFFTRTGLVAIEPKSGAVRGSRYWRATLDASVNAASPVVRGEEVFLSSSYGTGAIVLKASKTEPEWEELWKSDRSLSCHFNTPVLVGDYLYGIDGRQEGGAARLRCIEWKTGQLKWSADRFGCASLMAVDGGLLAITESGDLVRLASNPERFDELGKVNVVEGRIRAAPALADGVLYLRDETKLYAISLK